LVKLRPAVVACGMARNSAGSPRLEMPTDVVVY